MRFAALAVLALLCGRRADARHPDEIGAGELPWRVGGRVAFTVDAASFPDSVGHQLEVYVRIPPATLMLLGRDSLGGARLRVTARVRGGGRSHEAVQEFSVGASDSAGGLGKVVLLRFPTQPGGQRLSVRLDDLGSRKRGIAYVGRQVTESGQIEGQVAVPPTQAGRDLSDLEFLWTEARAGAAFQRDGRVAIPNPERLYGLFATDVRAAFVAHAPSGGDRSWHWVARVLDRRGAVVALQESTTAASPWLRAAVDLPIATDPAGDYQLEVKAWQEGDPGAVLRHAPFSVGWRVDSWMRSPRDIEDDVHFLLQAEAEEAFAAMSPGEQERYLEDFWRVRDPDPDTAENQARATFLQRVDYANRTYTRPGLGKGMFSDMGRTYIRYGEPSEVSHQVIPTGSETLDQVLYELSITEDRAIGDVHTKGPGGDQRPFEVWIYEAPVGLPPDADPNAPVTSRHKRLVFLFVDEQGLGDYRLRYSTE